jgi:hypothetical protein
MIELHVIWPFVDLSKVFGYYLFHLGTVFEDFWFSSIIVPFYSRNYRMISLDSKNFIGNLIELLHLAFSQQCTEVLYVLSFFEYSGDHEFLLVFFDLVPVMVPYRYMLPTFLLLLCLELQSLSDCLFWDIFICRLSYSTLTSHHVLDSLVGVD